MTEFIPQRKIGERVLIEGIIEEVADTRKSKVYTIKVQNWHGWTENIRVFESEIKEVIGYDTFTKAEV